MKKYSIIVCLLFICKAGFSQTAANASQKKFEQYSYLEMLFSGSNTYQNGEPITDKIRFSPVINAGHEFHFNLSKSFGLYTGLGVRNIGFIDRPVYFAPGATAGTELKTKKRIYALVIPLAVKLGKLSRQSYLSGGAELNIFMNYKEKIWQDDSKTKKSEWFSDRVDVFHTSVFLQYTLRNSYIKCILYPDNLVKSSNTTFAGNLAIDNYPSSSANVFALALGFRLDKIKYMSRGRTMELHYN